VKVGGGAFIVIMSCLLRRVTGWSYKYGCEGARGIVLFVLWRLIFLGGGAKGFQFAGCQKSTACLVALQLSPSL
jgi:hypothetical protein